MRYYLIYRARRGAGVEYDQPIGGLVGEELSFSLARDVAEQRFHAAPYERLYIVRIQDDNDHGKLQACCLHRQYELEMGSFVELMKQ